MSPLFQTNMTRPLNRPKVAINKFTPRSNSRKIAQKSRRFHPSDFSTHIEIDISSGISVQGRQIHLPLARQCLISQKSYRHTLEPCNIICSSCQVLHWIHKHSYRSRICNPLFFTCCQRGQILLSSFPDANRARNSHRRQGEGVSRRLDDMQMFP